MGFPNIIKLLVYNIFLFLILYMYVYVYTDVYSKFQFSFLSVLHL